jgi:hypothetical protein
MIDDSAARRLPDPPAHDPFDDEALSDASLRADPALREIHDSLLREMTAQPGLYLLTGDDGLGKTALLRTLSKTLRAQGHFVSLLPGETLAVSDLLLDLSLKAGIAPPVPKGIADWLARFHEASAGAEIGRPIFVVIVDDADNVADDILDGLAALLFQSSGNSGTLRLLLGGRPEFAERLAKPTHATLHQALVNHLRLGLLAESNIDILARIAGQVQEAMQRVDAVRRDVDSAPLPRPEDDTIFADDLTIRRPIETDRAPILSEPTNASAPVVEASRAVAVRPNARRRTLRPVLACLAAGSVISALLLFHPFTRPAVEASKAVDPSVDAVEIHLASSAPPAAPQESGAPDSVPPATAPKAPDAAASAADNVIPLAPAPGGISTQESAAPAPPTAAPAPVTASAWETPAAEIVDPVREASNGQAPAQSVEAQGGGAHSAGELQVGVAAEAGDQTDRAADSAPPPVAASAPVDAAAAPPVRIATAAAPAPDAPPLQTPTATVSPPLAAAPAPVPPPDTSKAAQTTVATPVPPPAPPVDKAPSSPAVAAPVSVPPPITSKTAQTTAPVPVPPPAPGPAAPAAAAPTAQLPSNVVALLMKRGDELMELRDIAGARLLFERAAMAGNARAAMMAGKTYDPAFFREAGVIGFRADRTKAIEWYRRAVSLGNNEANARIQALGN